MNFDTKNVLVNIHHFIYNYLLRNLYFVDVWMCLCICLIVGLCCFYCIS